MQHPDEPACVASWLARIAVDEHWVRLGERCARGDRGAPAARVAPVAPSDHAEHAAHPTGSSREQVPAGGAAVVTGGAAGVTTNC